MDWWTEVLYMWNVVLYTMKEIGDFFSKTFVARIVKKLWSAVVRRIEKYVIKKGIYIVGSISPGFKERYLKRLIIDHGKVNTKGLGLINPFKLDIDQVFVEPIIALSSNPNKPLTNMIKFNNFDEKRDIWDFIRVSERGRKKKQMPEGYALIGPPGCGKTTLLKKISVMLAHKCHSWCNIRPYVPIFIPVRQIAKDIVKDARAEKPKNLTFGDLARKYFSNERLFPDLKPPDNWFDSKLKKGKCIVLLDGLDEVGDVNDRKDVSEWVDRQIGKYSNSMFLLTSRPLGYQAAPLDNVSILEMQNFDAKQVKSFINNFYCAIERGVEDNVFNYKVRERAKYATANLLQQLQKVPALNAFTVNPLLLTMIVMVHRYSRKGLPVNRSELYDEICEVMLSRWRQTIGIVDDFTSAQKRSILELLAYHMVKRRTHDIKREDAIKLTTRNLHRIGVKKDEKDVFFLRLEESSGLLVEQEDGILSFVHPTFQDFFTASRWLNKNRSTRNWQNLVSDSWWHETLRLYAARGDATGIINACLDASTIPSLVALHSNVVTLLTHSNNAILHRYKSGLNPCNHG